MVISPSGCTKKGAAAIGRRHGRIQSEISIFVFFFFFADDVHEWIS
jgi:hypothetical protein